MKQFKGFKPEAMQRIAGTLGYQGDMQGFNEYLNQNPDKMQQMGMYQQKALQMVNGGMVQNFANGGDVDYSQYFDQEGRLRKSDGSLVPTFSQTRPDATTPASTTSQMGTGDPQSNTYQDSLGPAGTPTETIAKDQLSKGYQTADMVPIYDSQGNITGYGPSLTSDGTGVSQQPATGIADPRDTTTVAPTQTRVDTLAGAKAKAQQEQVTPVDTTTTTPVDTAITPAVEEEKEPDYSTFFDDAGNERNMDGSLVPIDPKFDYKIDDPIVDDPVEMPTEPEFEQDEDTKAGMPFYKDELTNIYNNYKNNKDVNIAEIFKNPKVVTTNLDGTPSGKIKVMFDVGEGQTTGFEVANALEAEAVINSSENFSANLETFLEDQTKYRKYISDQSAKDVDTDIKDIKNSYDKVTKDIVSKKVEIGRLQKLVLQNPDSERYDKETDSIIKYNSYYQELLDNKVEELADDVEREAELKPVLQSTQRTVKDLTTERFDKPADSITEEAGTKVMADKINVEDNQFIKEGTGQLDSVAQGVTTKAKSFDASGPDTVSEQTYDGKEVTDTAEEKLKKLEAQTQDTLTREVVGQTDDIRTEGIADDAIKVAADRIERAVNPTDLEVTAKQLAEVKGKDRVAIEANIAVSDRLKKIVAQTSTVDPKELPPPAKISDSIMRSVQAMKETDTGLSDETTDYIAAKMEAFTVSSGTLAVAMQGDVTAQATVQGQLSSLMKSFDNGTPAWAAGAIRAANEAMLSRGMAASSMAAAAIVQAAMESALPIAQQDAQVYAAMGMANLDNQQKVSLANAAAQQGLSLQNLSNEQQMNLQNSVQAFDLQKVNLSNRQSVELANAQIRTTLQGKVLDNTQQSNIITAARYAEQANINLSNKQQAVLQDNVGALQTNLADASAKQQSYITSANLAQALQGQVLTNDQQVAISNAARYSDAANLNFTSDQQEVLHNSSLMQSIGLAELNTTQAATLQNAANFATMDMAELSNAQQAQVLNAQNFLQLDLANLSNEQQVAIFKAQAIQQTLLSDQASVNASEQFNATSEMQVDQFNANLKTQVDQFNKAQQTAISQFNAGQDNAMEQFNVAQSNAADQFNAQNELVIAQSNATWRREVATADTAAQNRANEINAKNTLDIQNQAYDNMWQHYGDQMDNAYKSAENEADRAGNYAIAQLQATTAQNEAAATRNAGASKSIGSLAATLLTSDLSGGILKGLF